jgi:hypothetical protein
LRRRIGTGRDSVLADEGTRGAVRRIDGVALRRACEIQHALRERQLAFGRTKPFIRCNGVERLRQRTRIGKADVLGRHPDEPASDVERIGAAVEHAAHPVQRRIRIGPANGLVQRGDLVVERFAALVETPQAARDRVLDERDVDDGSLRFCDGRGELLDEVDSAVGHRRRRS